MCVRVSSVFVCRVSVCACPYVLRCDGKRPLCGQCARRRPAAPRACSYRDKHETHAALRRRAEALQAEVTEHENTMNLLINLPDDEALRLLHHLRATRPPPPPQQNHGGVPPPLLPPSASSSPLDGVGGAPPTSHHDTDDGDDDNDDDDDGDGTETFLAIPIPPAHDATLPLPTTNPPSGGSPWPEDSVHAFVYPPPMPDSGEYLYPDEDGLSVLGRLPTTTPPMPPMAESVTQWRDLYWK